jgi:AcrR family transcriptional regulator
MSTQDGGATRQPRLSRTESKARTRSLLLDAAAAVVARKGYSGASVEEIAETAGFSIGALYSNFSGKDELFTALLSARSIGRTAEAIAVFAETDTPIEQRRAGLATWLVNIADKDTDLATLEAEFWLYAMRRPELQATLAEQFRDNRDSLAQALRVWAEQQERPDDIPLDKLATILLALFQGLVNLRRTDQTLVPDQLYAAAIRWLFTGISAEHGPAHQN